MTEHGTPAPGPAPEGMQVPPTAAAVLRVPPGTGVAMASTGSGYRQSAVWRRSSMSCVEAEAAAPAQGRELLTAIPGIGQWTAAETSSRAFGDSDAVSVGDYHLARNVTFALTGRTDGTDETCWSCWRSTRVTDTVP